MMLEARQIRRALDLYLFFNAVVVLDRFRAVCRNARAVFTDDHESDTAKHEDHRAHKRPCPDELHLSTVGDRACLR
jgi:hypothetical protein